ncbi:MAG: DUF5659 domain-containing protein [Candidatus Marinimicrobia bacterium]|nr:DUF5659 domain-containing protein [Candidatus Neomarinimicrobiota bacterium]
MQNLELNDFYLAAYLIASGYEMLDISRIGNQSIFIFEGSEEIRRNVGNYYANTADVNAPRFAQEIKKLKNIIHTTYTEPGADYGNKGN